MVNLFVYGTLMNPRVVKRVTGTTFKMAPAVLEGYDRILPGTGYSYIVPRENARVNGFILYDVDDESLAKIDRYEAIGELYDRREVDVLVRRRKQRAHTYFANVLGLRRLFGKDIAEPDPRLEAYLEEKLELLLDEESPNETTEIELRAKSELLGATLEELAQAHFVHPADLSYRIRQNLQAPTIPNFDAIRETPAMWPYANAYVAFAVRHMIFNQLEKKVRRDFAELVHMPATYFGHTLSDLIALMFMNERHAIIEEMIHRMEADAFDPKRDYLDYAMASVRIADALYNQEEFARFAELVHSHRQEGRVPLGAEMEFSNLGRTAPEASEGQDPIYDGFYYFHDFDLGNRCWKLGGHVDDHRFSSHQTGRSRGFLEYAYGRMRVTGDLSRPATNDPWVLSELIRQGVYFSGLMPHSLHITMQVEDLDFDRVTPPEYLFCLLLLGGDIHPDEQGELHEWRIYNRELKDEYLNIHFTEENMHFAARNEDPDAGHEFDVCSWVVEYKFPRLRRDDSYEALIMAIKGFQLGYRPRPLGSRIRVLYDYATEETEALIQWATHPQPLSARSIRDFVGYVEKGLLNEADGQPAHRLNYIRGCLDEIELRLLRSNREIADYLAAHPQNRRG